MSKCCVEKGEQLPGKDFFFRLSEFFEPRERHCRWQPKAPGGSNGRHPEGSDGMATGEGRKFRTWTKTVLTDRRRRLVRKIVTSRGRVFVVFCCCGCVRVAAFFSTARWEKLWSKF